MIDDEGGISKVFQADVTNEQSVKSAVAKIVEAFGAVHILVNIGMNCQQEEIEEELTTMQSVLAVCSAMQR